VVAVATVLVLFFVTKDAFHQHALGLQITWGKNLWWKAMEWYAWALMSPAIFKLCRRSDFSVRPWPTVAIHLACGAIISLLHCCVLTTGALIEAQVLQSGLAWPALFKYVFSNHFHEDVLTYAAIVSLWYALDYHDRFRERESRAFVLEARLTQARLQALKMQLHPHFLFNTLNGIAALTHGNPKAANRMLAKLSDLLRMSLDDEGAQEVSLRSELEFIRRYLELEQIRFDDRLTVILEIAPDTLDALVPKLVLQPLVENAIRHGIAPLSVGGQINVQAYRTEDTLHLRVMDNGLGLCESNDAPGRAGVGLTNTRARLAELYGTAQQLELKNAETGGLAVEIRIPFRASDTREMSKEMAYEDSHLDRR